MIRVGFVGVPGAGKTSTARALSAFCRKIPELKRVELISEYARRYIAKYGLVNHIADQYKIMSKQLEWEDVIPADETDLIITDSPVHLGWLYVMGFPRDSIKSVMYINDIFKVMNKTNYPSRYDIIFHLPPVLKPVEDGVRIKEHFDEEWRKEADYKIRFIFKLFPPKKFVALQSTGIMERVEESLEHIKETIKLERKTQG